MDNHDGAINNTAGWYTFLNYYYWLQNIVDTIIGNVLNSINTTFAGNPPVIIFTSDHGDYGGSHNMHAKAGALYDESINVPLLIQWQAQGQPYLRTFACSSVDILPFIYTAALGNASWRNAQADMVYYLRGRESIEDFMFNASTAILRRVAMVPNAAGGLQSLQYVLHSTDEYNAASIWDHPGVAQPSHALAFRTVDPSYNGLASDNTLNFFGGGKLGMYTYWIPGSTCPNVATNATTQFEFYDYYTNNYGETGNQAFDSGSWNGVAGGYLNAYNNIMAGELYNHYGQVNAGYTTAFSAYMNFLGQTNAGITGPNTIPTPARSC